MSVAALVTLKPGAAAQPGLPYWKYIPVATQRTFTECWLPLAESLGLEYIPLFSGGISLTGEDFPAVLRELEIFSGHVTDALPQQYAEVVAERVELLRSILASAIASPPRADVKHESAAIRWGRRCVPAVGTRAAASRCARRGLPPRRPRRPGRG